MRKVFLVVERLSRDDKLVSVHDKDMNEELDWAVNYELGILDPCVEDPEHIVGGKESRINKFHPYQNEHEMKLALKFIFITQDITELTGRCGSVYRCICKIYLARKRTALRKVRQDRARCLKKAENHQMLCLRGSKHQKR